MTTDELSGNELSGTDISGEDPGIESSSQSVLSREDRDTIGEMTNISMGAAVSTLSVLLGQWLGSDGQG